MTVVTCSLFMQATGITANSCSNELISDTPPLLLSQTCLYKDINQSLIYNQLQKFTPNYQLWSDGANKSRWIYLPINSKINTQNPDRWIFPTGTQFFKEFRKPMPFSAETSEEIKVETRHFIKIESGYGIDKWRISTYLWQADQLDASLSDGATNVLNTNHDIPSQEDCVTCHKGNIDIILGFEAIQLSDAQAKFAFGHGPQRGNNELTLKSLSDRKILSHPVNQPRLPGSELEQKALGYLHANCGNCHNPSGHAAEQEAQHLKMRHKLKFDSVSTTHVYQTAVNQPTKNFTYAPYIVMGANNEELAIFNSALILRMLSTDENYRMPMIARKTVDYQAVELLHQWILTLQTPDNFEFNLDRYAQKNKQQQLSQSLETLEKNLSAALPLEKTGLNINLQFLNSQNVPPVMLVYWPEDTGLQSNPVMDHEGGYFTEKLIIGNRGSQMTLRNSDEVGHTIYVKDKKQDVNWRLNYMPPNSEFKQALFWEEDVFVEMRCKLHLYMSAWAGSVSSRYNKIFEFSKNNLKHRFAMKAYPEKFTQVKIWLPKFDPIVTNIKNLETQTLDLKKAGQLVGKVKISRMPLE